MGRKSCAGTPQATLHGPEPSRAPPRVPLWALAPRKERGSHPDALHT